MEEYRSVLTLGYYHVVPMGLSECGMKRSCGAMEWIGKRSDGVVLVREKLLKQLNVEGGAVTGLKPRC